MKKTITLFACTATALLLASCGEETKESSSKGLENPVDTYMDSRVNAMDMAKQSVNESNKKTKEQDKAMEALLGK